jgi:hypothetical protein
MELERFISESLQQICKGIQEAKKSVKLEDCQLGNPIASSEIGNIYSREEKIHFDIAVSVTEENKLNIAGEGNLKILKGGAQKENLEKTEQINNISFSIPFHPNVIKGPEVPEKKRNTSQERECNDWMCN